MSHAQLFTGAAGAGTLPLAVAYAQYLNCRHRADGDSCGVCPDCRQIAALAHPDLHLVFPVNKQGKKAGEVITSDAFLPLFRTVFARSNGYFSPQEWYDALDLGKTLRGAISAREADEIIRKLSFKSFEAEYKVMLVWLPETMNEEAANKILKILEEPPEHLMFILATTELHKVPATILSRCQRFSFKRILPRDMERQLLHIAQAEQIDLSPDGAELLARMANGARRDALSLLVQCRAVEGTIDNAAVLEVLGLAGATQTVQLMRCVLERRTGDALALFDQLYRGGKDVAALLSELSVLCRDMTILRAAPDGGSALLTGLYDRKTLAGLAGDLPMTRFLYLTET